MGALHPTPTPRIGWAATGLGKQTVPHPRPRSPTRPSPSLLLQKPTPAWLPPEAPRVPVFSSLPGPRFLQVGHRTSIERKTLAPPPLWVLPTHTKICLLKAQPCQYLVLQSLLYSPRPLGYSPGIQGPPPRAGPEPVSPGFLSPPHPCLSYSGPTTSCLCTFAQAGPLPDMPSLPLSSIPPTTLTWSLQGWT